MGYILMLIESLAIAATNCLVDLLDVYWTRLELIVI